MFVDSIHSIVNLVLLVGQYDITYAAGIARSNETTVADKEIIIELIAK